MLSFKNGDDDPTRYSFDKYYIPLLEIEDFNAWINNKPFFDQQVKSKHEAYKKLEMSRNNDYTTENLLDYLHHQKYYKGFSIDLSRQKNTSIPQKISFVRKLEEDDDLTIFFIAEKQQKMILNLSLDLLIVRE